MRDDSIRQVQELHAAYLREVGLEASDLPLNVHRERWWSDYINVFKMTLDDLIVGIELRNEEIRRGIRTPACRKLTNIIGDFDALARFQDDVVTEKQRRRAKEQIREKVATRMRDVHEASVREFERKFYNQ